METGRYYRIYTFDWDNNVIDMPTKIIIHDKVTGKSKQISTEEYALHRTEIGVSGPYKDYEVDYNDKSANYSYRFFRDSDPNDNQFLLDLISALKKKTLNRRRSWDSLIQSLSDKDTAKTTYIITARGHKPSTIFEAFKHLQKEGVIKYLPLQRNIYPVSYKFNLSETTLEQGKAQILVSILDYYAEKIKEQDYNSFHKFSFSDDDDTNITTVASVLGSLVKTGRWANINIYLHYTGEKGTLQPGTYVIGYGGELLFQRKFKESV